MNALNDSKTLNFIGGQLSEPAGGEFFQNTNPATYEHLSDVALGGPEDIERAVAGKAGTEVIQGGPESPEHQSKG